jgi:hypothetical protein
MLPTCNPDRDPHIPLSNSAKRTDPTHASVHPEPTKKASAEVKDSVNKDDAGNLSNPGVYAIGACSEGNALRAAGAESRRRIARGQRLWRPRAVDKESHK